MQLKKTFKSKRYGNSYIICKSTTQMNKHFSKTTISLRCWNTTGLVSSRVSLTSWGKNASLALVNHSSTDVVTIEIPYWVDVLLHQHACIPSFAIRVVWNWIWIIDQLMSVLGRWTLVVAVISVDACPFLAYSDLMCAYNVIRIFKRLI